MLWRLNSYYIDGQVQVVAFNEQTEKLVDAILRPSMTSYRQATERAVGPLEFLTAPLTIRHGHVHLTLRGNYPASSSLRLLETGGKPPLKSLSFIQ